MEEVRELMEEIPLDDEVSLALTDDPMSTFTALEIMSERSK
jgi:c-di-GMP-related signal transduction protein